MKSNLPRLLNSLKCKQLQFSPFWMLLLVFATFSFSGMFAADSVVVQTFTWDSIICRQSAFKFPDKSEKFYKVIGKYRLKCDPKTQHDGYDCGEWDYHAYTRILNYPAENLMYADTKHPATTFGKLLLPPEGQSIVLTKTQTMDKYRCTYYKTNVTSSNAITHKVVTGDSSLGSYASHQFLIRSSDLTDAGLVHNDKIGQMVLSANIVDTMKNVIIRASQIDVNSIASYQMEEYDTVAILQHITPQDCVNGKVMINFMQDLVWSDGNSIVFEILCSPTNNSANTFKGTFATGRRANIGLPFNYAVFENRNSWIDVNVPNIASKLKGQFTIEGWFKVNTADTAFLNNAVLFSIGDKFVVRLGSNAGDSKSQTKIYIEKFNEENQINSTKSNCIKYNQWQHIAVVFNGGGEVSPDRLRVYIDGANVPLSYQPWGVNAGWAEANSYVHHYLDPTDANFTIGKGEYAIDTPSDVITNSNFTGAMSQIRVWSVALTEDNINNNRYLTNIPASDANYDNLIINLLCNESYAARTMVNSCSNYSDAVGRVVGDLYFDNKPEALAIPYQSTRAFIPELELITGDFTYNNAPEEVETEVEQIPVSLVEFDSTKGFPDIPALNGKVSYPAIKNITYHYRPVQNVYDANHNIIETNPLASVEEYTIPAGADLYTYSKRVRTPWQIFEIGRYITPYGIGGLPIVDDGFEWEYDYTDYMHLLRDSVMLAVHNLQELIDLQFVFYKGEPIREVLSVSEPWGPTQHSVLYKDLVADKSFAEPRTIALDANTKSVKLKTRITGHGMERSSDGRQQCCEFYENTHYLYADTNKVAGNATDLAQIKAWRIWRSCTENPIFPQGGTWFYQREGWCPGDAVTEYEHELTPYIKDDRSISVQYGISDAAYRYDPKMGNGYYTMGLQLVQYGESKYKNDLELYRVMHPSTEDLYSRFNPICNGIELTVRNNSDANITSFDVEVTAVNPDNISHTVTCSVPVSRIIQPHTFYTGKIYLTAEEANNLWAVAATSSTPQITIKVANPINSSGLADENPSNNEITQTVKLPDIWNKSDVAIRYRTNNEPSFYKLSIYDGNGDNIKQMSGPNANTNYEFKLDDLPDGCYTFEIECSDMGGGSNLHLGLSNGFYPEIGSGAIGFYSPQASKAFQPAFGRYIRYSFVLNRFTSIHEEEELVASVYPNPATNVLFIGSFESIPNAKIDIYDISGNVVFSKQQNISENDKVELDVSALITGTYQVRISNDKKVTWTKFIKE